MTALDRVGLTPLMARTQGSATVAIGLIDGPVAVDHSNFAASTIRGVGQNPVVRCRYSSAAACAHGTLVAAMLVARGNGQHSGICPDCTLLVRPVFHDSAKDLQHPPGATPLELADALLDCMNAGARVINLSLALAPNYLPYEPALQRALDDSVRRGVILVAAAGNQNAIGGTIITNHSWPIPVMACDLQGRPADYSNFGPSIGRGGLSAPGSAGIAPSVGGGRESTFGGTSIAAPYVTGTVALLWSLFPKANAQQIKLAVTSATPRRAGLVAPVLNAWTAHQTLSKENYIEHRTKKGPTGRHGLRHVTAVARKNRLATIPYRSLLTSMLWDEWRRASPVSRMRKSTHRW